MMLLDILLVLLIIAGLGYLISPEWRWILGFCVVVWGIVGWMAYIYINRYY